MKSQEAPHLHLLTLHKEIKEIFLSTFFRGLAYSIIGIFIPIYIMTLGYSLKFALIYLAVWYGSTTIFAIVATYIGHKYGVKHTIMLGPILSVVFFTMLFLTNYYHSIIYIIIMAIIQAASHMMFWIPINSDFSKYHSHKQSATQASFWAVVGKTTGIIGPLLGAVLIEIFTYHWVFVISNIVVLISIFPLFMTKDYKNHLKYGWKGLITKYKEYNTEFFAQGIISMTAVFLLPLYIYSLTNNLEKTALIAAILNGGMLAFVVIIGRIADKKGKHNVMRFSAIILSGLWLILALNGIGNSIFLMSFLIGLTLAAMDISVFAIFINHLKKDKRTQMMSVRDVFLGLGKAAVLIPVILIVSDHIFRIAFGLSALASLYFLITRA